MGLSPQAFRSAVYEEYASGIYHEVCDDAGYRYHEMRMGLAQEFTPSGKPDGDRSPAEEAADRAWYDTVRQLLAADDLSLVIDVPPPIYKRRKPVLQSGEFLYVRRLVSKTGCTYSRRTGPTAADAMRERFMGEPFGMARLEAGGERVVASGKTEKMLRRYLGGIR